MLKFDMIVDDGFCRLNEHMIIFGHQLCHKRAQTEITRSHYLILSTIINYHEPFDRKYDIVNDSEWKLKLSPFLLTGTSFSGLRVCAKYASFFLKLITRSSSFSWFGFDKGLSLLENFRLVEGDNLFIFAI